MPTRDDLLRHLWDSVINSHLREDAIPNTISAFERDADDAPFAEAGRALVRLTENGASQNDLAQVMRLAAYEAVFATLYSLDDPGVDDGDTEMLHEELLMADPSGRDGRS